MKNKKQKGEEEVVLLKDLMPQKRITGGSGKMLFGERAADSPKNSSSPKDQKKDPKK